MVKILLQVFSREKHCWGNRENYNLGAVFAFVLGEERLPCILRGTSTVCEEVQREGVSEHMA